MKCILNKFLLLALFIGIPCAAQGGDSQSPILIGTYKYPGIDRAASIKPLLESVVANLNASAEIVLFDTPSELANAFQQGFIQVAVPNLASYLQVAQKPKVDFILLASPDTAASNYTSSIVTSLSGHSKLTNLYALSNKPIALVWSDSISGGLIGMSYIQKRINKGGLNLIVETSSVGSHEKVFKEVAEQRFDFGILATKVFTEESTLNPGKISEVWRSSTIPFGPLICAIEPLSSCVRLQRTLLANSKDSHKILQGLKKGWPEFANSTKFVNSEKREFEPLVSILN